MLMLLLTSLAQAVAVFLAIALTWGVPLYFISRETHVSAPERKLWMLASIFVPWIAFLVFMAVAPIKTQRPQRGP
ncbi:MAG: hypothetical protein AAF229_05565 [Pseudomonadota bacterium]